MQMVEEKPLFAISLLIHNDSEVRICVFKSRRIFIFEISWILNIRKSVFPDGLTIWLFKEQLKEQKVIDKLFILFNHTIAKSGFVLNSGNIVDATVVQVPCQRNTKEENKTITDGNIPEGWKATHSKLPQKDLDARWLKKKGKSFYGYKNHIMIDRKTKVIKNFDVTSANIYNGVGGIPLIKKLKKGEKIYGDSAYRNSTEFCEVVRNKKLIPNLCSKGYRNRPLSKKEKNTNYKISRIRSRVEHVFGDIKSFTNLQIRSIGIERAKFNIGVQNLVYNIRRFCYLMG